MMSSFKILDLGRCYASVCVPKAYNQNAIEELMNQYIVLPDMLTWTLCKESTFSSGQLNPHPCNMEFEHGPDRVHYLLSNQTKALLDLFDMCSMVAH